MARVEEIKSVLLLTHLEKEMVEKVAAIATITTVKNGEYIFRENDKAEYLYSLLEGKVALEIEKNTSTSVRVKDIVPNRTFGISALEDAEEKKSMSHARALTDCKLVCWEASKLERLFAQDPKLGLRFMKRISIILKNRLQVAYAQMAQNS
ncbi:cyclic nucleotide-binding domain-containing protein [bacterium]|nr:cyclic nucleotide-binding domain-containing protein [bacterium]